MKKTFLLIALLIGLNAYSQSYNITKYSDGKSNESAKGTILVEDSRIFICIDFQTMLINFDKESSVILFNKSTEVECTVDGRYCRMIRNYGELKYIIFVFSNGDRVRFDVE